MLENLIKLKYMVSISSRNMTPRGLNPNITTIIAKAIQDQLVMVVDVVTVVLLINQNCLVYGKECYRCHKKNHFSKHCRSCKSTSVGSITKCYLHCDVHEMEEKEIQIQYDTDAIMIKRTLIQFTTPVYNSPKELSSNVAFDEISNQPKHLQCSLTDLKLVTKVVTLIKFISN